MSDRYETPSWGDEPDDLATRSPVADDALAADTVGVEAGDPDLEASSENVLDGWPSIDPEAAPVSSGSVPVGLRDARSSGSASQLGVS